MKRYCGRDFSADDLQTIARLIEQNPTANRATLSRQVCRLFDWLKPDGGLKDMNCRVAMLRMQDDGLITLPTSQRRARRRPQFLPTAVTDAQPPISRPVHELTPLTLCPVTGTANSRLWNEYIARYHYPGLHAHGRQPDALLRLCRRASAGTVELRHQRMETRRPRSLHRRGRARAAKKPATRRQQRPLPDPALDSVQGPGIEILSMVNRQLPNDWLQRYGYRPVLLETFVETPRHRGTCYQAANWINVGKTTGRGKKSRNNTPLLRIKTIWLYPLRRNFRSILALVAERHPAASIRGYRIFTSKVSKSGTTN